MGDFLKADMDGQDAAATAVSVAAATLELSSAVGRAAGASGPEAGAATSQRWQTPGTLSRGLRRVALRPHAATRPSRP